MKNCYFLISFLCALTSLYGQVGDTGYISTGSAMRQFGKTLAGENFVVFPERRERPIRWKDSVRVAWLKGGHGGAPSVITARAGEYFVFQVGVWAIGSDLRDVQVHFSNLRKSTGESIGSGNITCFNSGGIDYRGERFIRRIDIGQGEVQPLWIGVQMPPGVRGSYLGAITLSSGTASKQVKVRLNIDGPPLADHGFGDARRLARLQWLNSKDGRDDRVTKGYLPVQREGSLIKILGRSMRIGDDGLPETITSYFSPSNQSIVDRGTPIVEAPFRLVIEMKNGVLVRLHPRGLQFYSGTPSFTAWRAVDRSEDCDVVVDGRMEYDGFVDYHVTMKARKELDIKDVRLEVDMNKDRAQLMMGLNRPGGLRPDVWDWKWDTATRDQDAVWLGAVNGGLRLKWKGENYVPPLVNVYYTFDRLQLPASWGNGGNGGVHIGGDSSSVLVKAYSGSRVMRAGEEQHYDFEMLITPFRTLDKNVQFGARYYHSGSASSAGFIRAADSLGANIINVHQGNDLYPFINYPYSDVNIAALGDFIKAVHADHKLAKVYYTTRELTVNLPELWPFVSLGGEIIYPGPGAAARTVTDPDGPDPWLKEQLRGRSYIPAWVSHFDKGKYAGMQDLSVITTPDSRLNNFYLAGLQWMVRRLHIDGIYIDDCSMDRTTIRRARKILERGRPMINIDMHSWDHYTASAGWASCINLYMDLLPYIDQLWIGEARNYNLPPDYWLVEISGIPFGIPSQMLQDGGNPWRGMVYGLTNRAGWTGPSPDAIWRCWDKYDLAHKTMRGYWDSGNPVSTGNEAVKATCYRGEKESVIAVANFGAHDQVCSLAIDLARLGYAGKKCRYFIPRIAGYQQEQQPASLNDLVIPGGKGYLVVVQSTETNTRK